MVEYIWPEPKDNYHCCMMDVLFLISDAPVNFWVLLDATELSVPTPCRVRNTLGSYTGILSLPYSGPLVSRGEDSKVSTCAMGLPIKIPCWEMFQDLEVGLSCGYG